MKETKVQISQLQQTSQRLQSQIENLKKQVRLPSSPGPLLLPEAPKLPSPLLLPLCQGHCGLCVQVS